jgi:plastocyanin
MARKTLSLPLPAHRVPRNRSPRLLTRRSLLRATGGAGLAALGLTLSARQRSLAYLHQDSTPMAGPELGPQADGSTLWRVQVGAMDMGQKLDLQAFFPGEITVNAGDSLWFDMSMPGFHTVFFPGEDGQIPDLIIPDPEAGTPTADAPPTLIYNPAMYAPAENTAVDGVTAVNSGVDVFRDPSQPFIANFPTLGTFDYVCIPHIAVMSAQVTVLEAGAELPMDQAGYDALAAEQLALLQSEGEDEITRYSEAVSEELEDGSTLWIAAAGAGPGQARVMAFLPETLEISVGDTVRWVNQSPGEPHTVTFVGNDETPPEDITFETYADGSPKIVQNMATFLPQGGNVFSGTGYVNSGFMGIPELGLPMEWECMFDTAGEYIYYCALHGDAEGNGMAARLIVS